MSRATKQLSTVTSLAVLREKLNLAAR